MRLFRITLCAAGLFAASASFGGQNWPQFRGPAGDGSSDSPKLPTIWSEQSHVKWKTEIHDRGWSSPVIWEKQIWMTTASEDGTKLFAVCVDRESGAVIQNIRLFEVSNPQFAHKFNTYASPSPVIEAGRVYVTFGSPGTACLETATGKVLWERRDFVCNHFRGAGSSPILFGDLLIMNFDGSDYQYVVALDKKTGKTVWKTDRSVDYKDLAPNGKPEADGDYRKAFSTPHVADLLGRPTLISSGAKAHYGYDPLTGKELWRVEDRSAHSASTRPVVGFGMIFIPAGFSKGQLLAIKPGKEHEVVDVSLPEKPSTELQVVWKAKRNVPNKPSVQLVGDLLFMVDDGGVASCLEAKTGQEVWRERVGGNYSASPLAAGGHVYFFSEEGKTIVIDASRQFNKVAENTLDDGFMSSPSASGNALFLRTRTHLYRIEE